MEVACGSGRAGPTGCLQVRVLFTDPSDGADCTPLIQRAHGEAAGSGQQVTPRRVASARGAPARSRPRGSRTTAAERGGRAGTLRPETPTSWPFTEKPWPLRQGRMWAWKEATRHVRWSQRGEGARRPKDMQLGPKQVRRRWQRQEAGENQALFPGQWFNVRPEVPWGLLLHQLSSSQYGGQFRFSHDPKTEPTW